MSEVKIDSLLIRTIIDEVNSIRTERSTHIRRIYRELRVRTLVKIESFSKRQRSVNGQN